MQLPFMPSSSSHPRSEARTSSFSSSALASSAVVVLFCGTSSGIMGMLHRKRWPSSTTASYVCSSASSAWGASDGLSRFDSSCVSCELAIDELELGDVCWDRRDVASFSVTYVSGHTTSYCRHVRRRLWYARVSLRLTWGNASMSSKTLNVCWLATAMRSTAGSAQKLRMVR
jgi:hypothetical protein